MRNPNFDPHNDPRRWIKAYAHRWIYEQTYGPIPDGLEIDHTCKNGSCVRIEHLEAVTQQVNNERNRLALCTAGLHDLSNPDNCSWDQRGRRRGCKLCKRTKALERFYRLRDQGGQ